MPPADLPAEKQQGHYDPPGLAATLLVGARTGKVIKETASQGNRYRTLLRLSERIFARRVEWVFGSCQLFFASIVTTCMEPCFSLPAAGFCALMLFTGCTGSRVIDMIPPQNSTKSVLTFTHVRIEQYWQAHQRVPDHWDQLPVRAWHDCSMTDGWGRKLNWESNGTNQVKVWSFGRDGIAGGTGDDADQETVFDANAKMESARPSPELLQQQ